MLMENRLANMVGVDMLIGVGCILGMKSMLMENRLVLANMVGVDMLIGVGCILANMVGVDMLIGVGCILGMKSMLMENRLVLANMVGVDMLIGVGCILGMKSMLMENRLVLANMVGVDMLIGVGCILGMKSMLMENRLVLANMVGVDMLIGVGCILGMKSMLMENRLGLANMVGVDMLIGVGCILANMVGVDMLIGVGCILGMKSMLMENRLVLANMVGVDMLIGVGCILGMKSMLMENRLVLANMVGVDMLIGVGCILGMKSMLMENRLVLANMVGVDMLIGVGCILANMVGVDMLIGVGCILGMKSMLMENRLGLANMVGVDMLIGVGCILGMKSMLMENRLVLANMVGVDMLIGVGCILGCMLIGVGCILGMKSMLMENRLVLANMVGVDMLIGVGCILANMVGVDMLIGVGCILGMKSMLMENRLVLANMVGVDMLIGVGCILGTLKEQSASDGTRQLSVMSHNTSNGKLVEPIRLEEQLDIQSLEELMYRFKTHLSNEAAIKTWKTRRGSRVLAGSSHMTGLMTLEEFRSTLAELLNVDSWDVERAAVFEKEMEALFKKVDIASDGLVDWDEFCTYMMIQFKEHDLTTKYGKSFSPKFNIARIVHNKETTSRILRDFNPMRYVTVSKGLFETPFKKTSGSHKIFFQDISIHSRFVIHLPLGVIHSDWVRRVQYVSAKEFVISCSSSSKDSLVVRDVDDKKRKSYVFKVAKGIDCFDYNHTLNVIVTGGVDHAVRVWNPYVTIKPVAIMKSHQSSIVDLIIHQTLGQVFSYDKDGLVLSHNILCHAMAILSHNIFCHAMDDILASAYCPPYFLVTASFDGDIILWSLDREKMIRILKKGSRSLFKSKLVKVGLIGQRDRRLSRLQAQQSKRDYSPVDRLLFLTTRAQNKAQESATLVSSENGILEFWCLYGTAKPMGN
ncbi:hypothetical protein QZH41_003758 [Actinostola sp. cb2023]|nr:hypothetical protein QZH41_003758 [Actinostola sp. cb2023]